MSAPGVLGNDTDADLNPLTAILVTDVSHGVLALASNGGFTYTPTAGYNGPDSFTYKANDGTDDSNTVTVSLAVGNVALDLGSAGAYVTFGDPAKLDLAQFTIETWFKRTGTGVASTDRHRRDHELRAAADSRRGARPRARTSMPTGSWASTPPAT